MAYKTTKDILDQARAFHEQLSAYYRKLSVKAQRQRVRMLLDYMSRHEKHLEECLLEFEQDASRKILETWFKYTPQMDIPSCFEDIELSRDMCIDDVIKLALRLDDCLVELYKGMVKEAESRDVKKVFTNLLEMEKHEKMNLVRDAIELKEI